MKFIAVESIFPTSEVTRKEGPVRQALCSFLNMGVHYAKVNDDSRSAESCYKSLLSGASRMKLPVRVQKVGENVFVTNLAYEK